MDSKQKGIVILAVVVVVIAAVFAAQALDDKHNESDAAEVNFLIQDNQGFYFWVNGEGETVYDAWKDAVKSFDLPFVASVDKEGNEYGIKSLFGLSTAQDATGGWTWWTQYFYNGSAWESNSLYMINMAAKDYSSIAMVYGDGKVAPAVAPSDAKVWNKDTTGTLFTIQSPSGMYFRVNGTGATAFDAWVDAMVKYNVQYEPSESSYGKGITSMFGLTMTQDAEGNYTYWNQDLAVDGAWSFNSAMMSNTNVADGSQMLLYYVAYGATIDKAPIYGTS